MPRIRPFPALHFDPDRVELGDVLVPALRPREKSDCAALVRREEHSIVRLINGFETGWYAEAARLYRAWRAAGILAHEEQPALYVLHQTTRVEGRQMTRKGFFAACSLHDDEGREIPSYYQSSLHQRDEQYRLLDACGAFFEPVICGYRDERGSLDSLLVLSAQERPWLQCEWNGGTCSVWRVTAEAPISHALHFFEHAEVAILEGKHVYDAAIRHAQRPDYAQGGERGSAASVPAFFCNVRDGVTLPGAVHRALHSSEPVFREEILARLHKNFSLHQYNREQGMEALRANSAHGILIAWPGMPTCTYARLKNPDLLETLLPAIADDALRSFDVSLLHRHLLEEVFEIPYDRQLYADTILCSPEAGAVFALVQSRKAVGFLLQPPPLDLLMESARKESVLPYPAAVLSPGIPAGLVMHALN